MGVSAALIYIPLWLRLNKEWISMSHQQNGGLHQDDHEQNAGLYFHGSNGFYEEHEKNGFTFHYGLD